MVEISSEILVHKRHSYSLYDFFGDYGGMMGFISMFLTAFAQPVADHSFLLEAIRKLYLVKTED